MTKLNNIKQIRWKNNITLRQLEKLSGVNYTTINNIENGLEIPTQIVMLKISRGLNMKTHHVFELDWEHCDY